MPKSIITVHHCRPEDVSKLLTLIKSAHRVSPMKDDALKIDHIKRKLNNEVDREGEAYIIARHKDTNEIVGMFIGWVGDDANYSPIEGHDIVAFVKPKWRRQGIAKRMLRAFERYCVKNNAEGMVIGVMSGDEKAVKFYEGQGYTRMPETTLVKPL